MAPWLVNGVLILLAISVLGLLALAISLVMDLVRQEDQR